MPIVLFPLLGIIDSVDIALNYMKEGFMFFIGGLIMAIAVEDSMLHERIALRVLLTIGTEIKWIMLSFMLTTMFLSMWISNMATTAIMVPIVDAVTRKISKVRNISDIPVEATDEESSTESRQVDDIEEDRHSVQASPRVTEISDRRPSLIKTTLLLSVCYSGNIGVTGTIAGTVPNFVLIDFLEEFYPGSDEITFVKWMIYNVPGMIFCVLVGWLYLWMVRIRCSKVYRNLESKEAIKAIISERYAKLGTMTYHEMEVMILLLILILLWVFREPKFMTGWAEAVRTDVYIGDSVPAIGIAFLMFLLPSNPKVWNSRRVLGWKTTLRKMPWGIILVIGGAFAMADAAEKSGLSEQLGRRLSSLSVMSPGVIVAITCFMTATLTEVFANITLATILLPILNKMALTIRVNPLFLMLPVTIACSYTFILPVSNPANAIAFESGNMRILDIAKPGLVMNLVCCTVQLFMVNTVGQAIFDLNQFPGWTNASRSFE